MANKAHEKIRRHGKVHTLPPEIRKEVDDLLTEPGTTYEDIAEFLKAKGHDIGKSSIGRYGKDYLSTYQRLRIVEDQARTLVSEAGEGLVLDEAGGKLVAQRLIEILMSSDIDIADNPKLLSAFASMQKANIAREKLKADLKDRVVKTADDVTKIAKKSGLSEDAAAQIRNKILGISK
ncbi:MAG: DUF3486 family protein [Nitrospirae bacterium]|nr:DUF3486 family protein [Nitrospirota bacterium]